jgi:hypothetical protein
MDQDFDQEGMDLAVGGKKSLGELEQIVERGAAGVLCGRAGIAEDQGRKALSGITRQFCGLLRRPLRFETALLDKADSGGGCD